MLKKKQVFFILIFFFSVIVYTINHSFSSIEKSYGSENDNLNIIENKFKSDAEADINYKSILGEAHTNFTAKIAQKAIEKRFHGVVLVAYKDQVIFEKAYGFKDPIHKDSLSPQVSFELASVSKQFTAASVLKLSELGQIDIDEPLKTYFPEFKFENIRIRDLLKHSSGLWDYMNLTEAYWNDSKAPNNHEIIGLINKHQTALSFKPGRRFRYNNTNYALLVTLVEKVSGNSFEKFMQENFFELFCLENTYVGVQSRRRDNVADAYQPYGRGYVKLPPSYHNSALCDKGIHATANDLWLWFKAIKNQESLSEDSVKKMFNLESYPHYDYGMGFRTKVSKSGELEIYHDGLWDGFRNGLHYFPEKDLTYIVLSHTQNSGKVYFQNYLERQSKKLINRFNIDKANSQNL